MIKKYVCEYCHGRGEIITWNLIEDEILPDDPNDTTGKIEDVAEKCPLCTGLGLPALVELRVNGPVSPREIMVEASLMPITQTLDGDPWKTEEQK